MTHKKQALTVEKEQKEITATKSKVVKTLKTSDLTKEELEEDVDTFLTTQNPYVAETCAEFDYKISDFQPLLLYKKPVVYYSKRSSIRLRPEIKYGTLYEEEIEEKKEEVKKRNKFNFRTVATQSEAEEPNYSKRRESRNDWMRRDINALLKRISRRDMKIPNESKYYLRLCERMLDQNMSNAVIDYSYYDNPNDEFQPNVGSLLPLWTLSCRVANNMFATCICWNSLYSDLFAVGYKTVGEIYDDDYGEDEDLDVVRQSGCICVYSLKGPNWPERIIQCPSGICSLQFHQASPHLLAASMAGGDLAVFDLRKNDFSSSGQDSKFEKIYHQDSVSEAGWLQEKRPQNLCSISHDGKIINWIFLTNYLYPQELVTNLKIKNWSAKPPPKGLEMPTKKLPHDTLTLNTTGLSLSVNSSNSDLFLVGTETGLVHRYTFDDQQCATTYEGHDSSVCRVRWNPFHPRVFLSSSRDLTVQVWDCSLKKSLFEFFFDAQVTDATWAPFSSTLLAVVSGNATIHVFDLAVNKMEAIGSYVVYTQKQNIRLTKVEFHPRKPIIIVGDERGNVILFKLSPNLRSNLKNLDTAVDWHQFVSGEIEKMEKILNVSIEPKI